MTSAPDRKSENQALASLRALDVLDSGPEQEFDALVRAASLICEVPISLISLIDAERQWFKANIGLPGVSETARDVAFCAHAVLNNNLLEVPDAMQDQRFADNPLVASDPRIRFYAGMPLQLKDGNCIGTLCVIDRKPRRLNDVQREVLKQLAIAAAHALENRREARIAKQLAVEVFNSESRFRTFSECSPLGVYYTDAEGNCTYTNQSWQDIYGMTFNESLGRGWTLTLHPEDKTSVFEKWQQAVAGKIPFKMDFRILHPDGYLRYVRSQARAVKGNDDKIIGYVGSVENIGQIKMRDEEIRENIGFLRRTGKVSGVAGWEVDLFAGTVAFSDEAKQIYGFPPEFNPSLEEVVQSYAPESQAKLLDAMKRAITDAEPFDLEISYLRSQGEQIWLRVVGALDMEDGKKSRLSGAVWNITERILQIQKLNEAIDRVNTAVEASGVGLWEWNLISGEGRWDSRMHVLYGLPAREGIITYDQWIPFVHPDDRARCEQAFKVSQNCSDDKHEIEFRIVRADRSVCFIAASYRVRFNNSGVAIRLTGANWDVTESRIEAKKVADQHENMRRIMLSIGDAVITTDSSGGVEWLNPVAEQITGWSATEANGRDLPDLVTISPRSNAAGLINPVAACLKTKTRVELPEHLIRFTRDDRRMTISGFATPILNNEVNIVGVVIVFHEARQEN